MRLVFEFFRGFNDFIIQKVYLLRFMPVCVGLTMVSCLFLSVSKLQENGRPAEAETSREDMEDWPEEGTEENEAADTLDETNIIVKVYYSQFKVCFFCKKLFKKP
jgi:hypothetical protein